MRERPAVRICDELGWGWGLVLLLKASSSLLKCPGFAAWEEVLQEIKFFSSQRLVWMEAHTHPAPSSRAPFLGNLFSRHSLRCFP